jgi:hypothetical protein
VIERFRVDMVEFVTRKWKFNTVIIGSEFFRRLARKVVRLQLNLELGIFSLIVVCLRN